MKYFHHVYQSSMKNHQFLISLLILALISCSNSELINESSIQLSLEDANKLAELPLVCIQKEFPNKLGQVISDTSDLKRPIALHPAFYGCFDWHSAVHGHWSCIKLLKEYPALDKHAEIKEVLLQNLSKENVLKEVDYFNEHKSYERTYGWAWYLKLIEELYTWDDPFALELRENLDPLTELLEKRYLEFLPRLLYPIREGTHSNTAFGLSFAWDYANTLSRDSLKTAIEERAKYYFKNDHSCPLSYEPGGQDFLSPCLEEVDLMRRVLSKSEFNQWITGFLPELLESDFDLPVGLVSDRTDGYLVHLDGLNFSRAWVLNGIADQYPEYGHLYKIANDHIQYSLPNLIGDSYEGGHWLGSFALYSLGN